MFCALLGHTGERLQDHWSSGLLYVSWKSGVTFVRRCFRDGRVNENVKYHYML